MFQFYGGQSIHQIMYRNVIDVLISNPDTLRSMNNLARVRY